MTPWLLVLAPLALVAALILMPWRLWVVAHSDPPRSWVRLRVMGRLMPWVTLHDSARPRRPRRRSAAAEPSQKSVLPGSSPSIRAGLTAMSQRGRAVLAVIRVERCQLRLRFGLGDPADTGQAFGILAGLSHAIPGGLRIEPDFQRLTLGGDGDVVLAVRPVRLIGPIARLVWTYRKARS